jgi:hypothetical protein
MLTLLIASGSWELETCLLKPSRRQVLYPGTGWFGSIVTYALRNRTNPVRSISNPAKAFVYSASPATENSSHTP